MSELNERAARAMGWERCHANIGEPPLWFWRTGDNTPAIFDCDWDPEHRIDHAWMLVEKCIEKGLFVDIRYDTMAWSVTVWKNGKTSDILELSLDNAAEAITRACVEALENNLL